MLGRLKRLFGRESAPPPGFVAADDEMRSTAQTLSSLVEAQALIGGLDTDPSNWVRDERAAVLGYIDGYLSRWYIGMKSPEKAMLAPILCAQGIFKEARTPEQIFQEHAYFSSTQYEPFDRARRVGWTDFEDQMGPQRRAALGLVRLLRGS